MEYRTIADTAIKVSEIGLGTWALGGLNWEAGRISSGWAPPDYSDVKQAVAYAIDHGVNHFDTADVYGNGRAERMLADAVGDNRNSVVIASKVGWFAGTASHAYEPQHIRHQCEQSLRNLRREYLDIYYFHHADFGDNDRYLDEAVETMKKLKQEGKIRCIGLSAYTQRDFVRLIPLIRPQVIQGWAHAMDARFIAPNSPCMRLCERFRISFIAFSPLNQGILLGKYSSDNPPYFADGDHRSASAKFRQPYLSKAEKALREIAALFGSTPESLARIALQYVLYHCPVAAVIPGFRSVNQVRINCAASGKPLSRQEYLQIRTIFNTYR